MIDRRYEIQVWDNRYRWDKDKAPLYEWRAWGVSHTKLKDAIDCRNGLIASGWNARVQETSILKIYSLVED